MDRMNEKPFGRKGQNSDRREIMRVRYRFNEKQIYNPMKREHTHTNALLE